MVGGTRNYISPEERMAIFAKETPAPKAPQMKSDGPSGPRISVIGPGLHFEGTIRGQADLLIDGSVKGNIDLQADLRIGESARIEATVHARNIVVEGHVVGDLSADVRVELVASAEVEGNVRSPKIIVAEGASFRGTVDMGSSRPKE